MTVELEADEPDPGAFTTAADDEQTGDFGGGNWARAIQELDFSDQRSAVPTREIAAPRGFVRSRIPGNTGPLLGEVPAGTGTDPGAGLDRGTDDDRLSTRPGRSLDPLDPRPHRLTPQALADFGGPGTASGRAGPDDLTREVPSVRLTLDNNNDSIDLVLGPAGLGDLGDDERTIERSAVRADTLNEPTSERGGASYTPAPIDEGYEGPPSGRYPPLVIIEDAVLTGTADRVELSDRTDPGPPGDRSEETTGEGRMHRAKTHDPSDILTLSPSLDDELSSGTARVRRSSAPPRNSSAVPSGVPIDQLIQRIEAAVEATVPAGEARADRTRRRVSDLIDRSVAASGAADHATAIVALDLALREDPESAVAQKLIHRHQPAILDVYQRFLGNLESRPALAMPMHELAGEKLDIRAAFLLSRIDGTLTFEEILDVSGMQRPEAFRHLSILLLRGILEVR